MRKVHCQWLVTEFESSNARNKSRIDLPSCPRLGLGLETRPSRILLQTTALSDNSQFTEAKLNKI